jgi:indolepyruvate ferredoxin oxidoreductase
MTVVTLTEASDPGNSAAGREATAQRAHLSGVQATVRFLVEVLRSDSRRGHRTAAFVSGYQGSPLAGFDQELHRTMSGLDVEIIHQPGVNEELGATAVMGSQLTATQSSCSHDGVLGVWYGKAPGLDRSMDALRHANYAGTSPLGGAIALVGDDPSAKSSTLPSASEAVLAELSMPTLFPRSLADIVELGQHAVALSRYSGSWVAMKLVTSVADAEGTVDLNGPIEPIIPDDYISPRVSGDLLTPATLEREAEVLSHRLAAATRYGDANDLNRIAFQSTDPKVALAASGTVFTELLEALRMLKLDADGFHQIGIRVGEIRMPYPIGQAFADALVEGVEDLIVIEERREIIEHQILSLVARRGEGLRIWGRLGADRRPFIPGHGTINAAMLAQTLYPLLASRFPNHVQAPPSHRRMLPLSVGLRVPWYCSGCPHSVSTVVPDGTLVGAGIGCHSIVRFMPEARVGRSIGITQMGGEGAQWIGMAPFLGESHVVQNMGDGTFFHSGHLAVRAAVSADVSMTFKILWNGVSAMTGGQHVQGSTSTVDVARLLLLEGVKQVIITTDDVRRYRHRQLPSSASVRRREDIIAVQQELAKVHGVTVMIHDQACATELRRARKRGLVPTPDFRVVINERVCEGCGDCQIKSNCLSLETVETTYGPKTRIDEGTCNVDLSCLAGDCPAFTLVKRNGNDQLDSGTPPRTVAEFEELPAAEVRDVSAQFTIRVAGIGGTGVVTTAHLLARAAMLDGLEVWGLDQTGLSQKAGPVISDLRIGPGAKERSNVLGIGEIDLMIAADLLAANQPLAIAGVSPRRTAIVGSLASTLSGPMILGEQERLIPTSVLRDVLISAARPDRSVFLDAAALSVRASGNEATANVVLLGVACQLGRLPVSAPSLIEAVKQIGVAVDANLAAFVWGRAWAAGRVRDASNDPAGHRRRVDIRNAQALERFSACELPESHRAQIAELATELIEYQNLALATKFLQLLTRVWRAERDVGGFGALTVAAAEGSFKLLAYKDEYEVARLLLDEPAAAGRTTWLLHPPMLRARGLRRKIHLGSWARPVMMALRSGRHLRGTWLDLFGRSELRKMERELIREYMDLVEILLMGLCPENLPTAIAIAALPQQIRGYEEVKVRAVGRYRAELAEQVATYQA